MLKKLTYPGLKTLTNDAIKITVGYPSTFSLLDTLLRKSNDIKSKLMQKRRQNQIQEIRHGNKQSLRTKINTRFHPNQMQWVNFKRLKTLATHHDFLFYSYIGKKTCRHFILIDIIKYLKIKDET